MYNEQITCAYLYIITKYGYPPPAENTIDYLKQMKELGFKSIELEGIREKHLLDMYSRRFDIHQNLEQLNLTVPYFCVVLPGLASADKKERNKNITLFEIGCKIAQLIGAKGVLDNAPLPPYQFPDDTPVVRHYDEDVLLNAHLPQNFNWKNYWPELIETFRNACDIAASYNLTFQMHPCLGSLSSTCDAFLYFYDAVGRDNLRFNFDTANQYMLKDNLILSLYRLADHIDYIHLSDNRGLKVEHLTPGQGTINWDLFFETLDKISFKGHIGLDIGGAESGIDDIENAYKTAAEWLSDSWQKKV